MRGRGAEGNFSCASSEIKDGLSWPQSSPLNNAFDYGSESRIDFALIDLWVAVPNSPLPNRSWIIAFRWFTHVTLPTKSFTVTRSVARFDARRRDGEREVTVLGCERVESCLKRGERALDGIGRHNGFPCREESQPDKVMAQ
jgi:hypothetical protein